MSRIYLAYRSKKQRFCAVQAFCAAKPWRRRNLFPPSIVMRQGSQNGGVRFGRYAPSEVTQKQLDELHIALVGQLEE